jgi:predicted amino acid dehydrogenase
MGRVNPIFKFFPEVFLRFLIKFLPPIVSGKVVIKDNPGIEGYIIVIPLTGSQFYDLPRDFVINKIKTAIKKAKKLGAGVVGLGEFTSSVSHGGFDLIEGSEITITNGNTLTAGIVVESIEKIVDEKKIDKNQLSIGIIGAAGSIGSAVAQILAKDGYNVLVNDKNRERLEKIISKIAKENFRNKVKGITNLNSLNVADIVIVTSSATESIITKNYLKRGAVVYDITQPRNVSPDLLKSRPDITIIDGGIIDTPQIDYGMDIGLNPNQAFACLVETILFALEGIKENSVGFVDPQKAKKMVGLMKKYPYFAVNFYSLGKLLK